MSKAIKEGEERDSEKPIKMIKLVKIRAVNGINSTGIKVQIDSIFLRFGYLLE